MVTEPRQIMFSRLKDGVYLKDITTAEYQMIGKLAEIYKIQVSYILGEQEHFYKFADRTEYSKERIEHQKNIDAVYAQIAGQIGQIAEQEEDREVERFMQPLPSDSHIALYNKQGELFPITKPSLWKRFKTNCVHYWDIMFGDRL